MTFIGGGLDDPDLLLAPTDLSPPREYRGNHQSIRRPVACDDLLPSHVTFMAGSGGRDA